MADTRASSSAVSRRARTGDEAIGHFIIGSEIGKGSFAQVYMGRHKVWTTRTLSCSPSPASSRASREDEAVTSNPNAQTR